MPAEDEQPKGLQGRLSDRFGPGGGAAYGFAGCAVAIALCGLAAYLANQPILFPRLGPSALLFFEKPTAPESSPYNAIVGHLVGIVAGVAAIAVFGLLHAPSVLRGRRHPGPGRRRRPLGGPGRPGTTAAAGQPPPAGATTLLVSLGLLDQPRQLAWVLSGVLVLTAVAWLLNRLAGLPLALRQD